MNYTLSRPFPSDSALSGRTFTAVPPTTFLGGFTSERLKAFTSHFRPSRQSVGERFGGVALTVGAYALLAIAVRELSTADLAPLLHVLHLNGV